MTAGWRAPAGGSSPSPTGPIEGIQILRAVAALMVVFHHARASVPAAQEWTSVGAAGVDIFFVISGFVMAHTTRRPVADRATSAIGDFLSKRLLRVVPLYWVALLWTARRDLLAGRFGSDLVKDFLFIPHPNLVYPERLWPSVIQGWTLNYEMFFYLLFAVSLGFRGARTWALAAALLALVATGAAIFGSSDPSIAAAGFRAVALRFYTDNILLEFLGGVLLQRFVFAHRSTPLPAWPRSGYLVAMLIGFGLLAAGCDRFPRGLLQGAPALLIVWSAIHAFAGVRLPTWERLGDASYAIYLFHWASFGAVKPVAGWLVGTVSATWPVGVVTVLLVLLHMAVAIAAGLLIHQWIERPFLRGTRAWFGQQRAPVLP